VERLAIVVFAGVGLVNALPLVGVLGADWLTGLYGVVVADADLSMLMRHRAVMFGAVGGQLVAAAFRPALRPAAGAIGLVSMGAFIVLASPVEARGLALQRVFWIDAASCLLLAAAMLGAVISRRT
jgi:hypothetical protein